MTEKEKEKVGSVIIKAMIKGGMTKDDIKDAFSLHDKGHDIVFSFLSPDKDNDDLEVLISWKPLPIEEREDAADKLYGHWRKVLELNKE